MTAKKKKILELWMHGRYQNTVPTAMARLCRFILRLGNTDR